MPPLPSSAGLAKVTFNQSMSSRAFGDSLFFGRVDLTSWSVAQLTALATNAGAAWVAHMLPNQDDVLTLDSVDALDLSDSAGRLGTDTVGLPGSGGGTHPLPLNSVGHFAFEVPRRYRGGRPGINLSGLDMADLSDQRTIANVRHVALHDDMVATITAIVGGAGYGAAITHVGVSYHDKTLFPVPPHLRTFPLVLTIADVELQQRLCTLRRRMGKPITP